MKKVIFLFMAILFVLNSCKSQDPALKAEKDAIQQAEQEVLFDSAVKALNDRKFVLEADRITFKNGRFTYVSGNTNFISLDGDRATIQIAFNSPYAGPNGIGGVTVEGTASKIKIETDKKGNITFRMSVTGVAVSANVMFQMIKGTNRCSATILPNFSNNTTTFTGYLYSKENSNVFKGRSL